MTKVDMRCDIYHSGAMRCCASCSMLTNSQVRNFFDAYPMRMNSSIADGKVNVDEFAQYFASDCIGASPMGIQPGENNSKFRTVIRDGITFYRKIGVRSMVLGNMIKIFSYITNDETKACQENGLL